MNISSQPEYNDRNGWRAYWDAQNQHWRTEPEIRSERQAVLKEHLERNIEADQNTSSFVGMRLDRSDIEWLLANHESRGIRGPININDPVHQLRTGVNLQGVDLREMKLGKLPLARTNFGSARLDRSNFNQAHLEQVNFAKAQAVGTVFTKAFLRDASFRQADISNAIFTEAHLESANLYQANCDNASFYNCHLEEAYLGQAKYARATIRRAYFDSGTGWNDTILWDEHGVSASLADARWGETNLATLDWSKIAVIGDEREAHASVDRDGMAKTPQKWQDNYRRAVRANRQLAVALRSQGMNEEADRFAYRAQLCQRALYRHQKKLGAYTGSGFLWMLAGYGFKPLRTLVAYLFVILSFAMAYYFIGHINLSPIAALIFSITSFHGRGFFPGGIALDSPMTILAACEAIIGLIIEISFIATFTQRFFAR